MNNVNFKQWAFHSTIWIAIINIASFYLTITYVNFSGVTNNTGQVLFYFGILSTLLLLLNIVFIVISSVRNEKKNYQYWISVVGIVLFGILPLIARTII